MIFGPPVSSKSEYKIVKLGNAMRLGRSNKVRRWSDDATLQLRQQHAGKPPLDLVDGKTHNRVEAWITLFVGEGQRMDVNNGAQGVLDALQRAGVVSNDYWICPLWLNRERDHENPRVFIELRSAS